MNARNDRKGTAIVTGAGGGIGRSLALKFAASGYALAVLDIDEKAATKVALEVEALGRRSVALRCDVTSESDLSSAAQIIESRLPPSRLVWVNAGVAHLGGVVTGPRENFDWIYAVNVTGAISTLRAFVPLLLEGDGRRHVGLTASVAGLVQSNPMVAAYCASKYALVGLGEALRAELGPLGIGVTIACPGTVNT